MEKDEITAMIIEVMKESGGYIIKRTYDDGISTPLKELGKGLTSLFKIGFFPFNWLASKTDDFLERTNSKINKIPNDKLQEPDQQIIGPAIEGLRYTMNNDEIRSMFSNLVSSSFNSDYNTSIHPSYAELIAKMNSLDAHLLNLFNTQRTSMIPIVKLLIQSETRMYSKLPEFYTLYKIGEYTDEQLTASFERLESYGLLKIDLLTYLVDEQTYKNFDSLPNLKTTQEDVLKHMPEMKSTKTNGLIKLTSFGKNFIDICVKE